MCRLLAVGRSQLGRDSKGRFGRWAATQFPFSFLQHRGVFACDSIGWRVGVPEFRVGRGAFMVNRGGRKTRRKSSNPMPSSVELLEVREVLTGTNLTAAQLATAVNTAQTNQTNADQALH